MNLFFIPTAPSSLLVVQVRDAEGYRELVVAAPD
jgi:hypothetical protein